MASMDDIEPARDGAGKAPRSRRYLVALTDGGGTVPPELGVARRLLDRGHRVTVLADDSLADQVRPTGAAFSPWPANTVGEIRDWELRSPLSLARDMVDHMIAGPAPGHAQHTAAAIDETPPDLVLASFTEFGAMIAAEARGIPFDVLLPNVYALPVRGMPPIGTGFPPAGGSLGRLRDLVASSGSGRLIDRYALKRINALRAAHGLDLITTTWDQVHRARRQLVLTSSHFDFPAELPPSARYVGPILDDPAWAVDDRWLPPSGDEPLVLVAMSSTFQNQLGCLQRVVDALGRLPVRGLVTTGPRISPADIRAPANVSVLAAAPHGEAMRHASVVVTHGGHGTVVKSLVAGLPLVILPHGRDQADNAVRVTTRGAGIVVSRRASARRIAGAIATVLDSPAYRRAAMELGALVAHDASLDRPLLEELEH